jgi:hypothetical protein
LIFKLTIETDKVSSDEILKKVAEAGHDNEKFKASDETYEALPGCCHYDRDYSLHKQNLMNHEKMLKKKMNSM